MAKNVPESLKLLGLSDSATWDEINLAYRDLVRVWHPDRFAQDERLKKKAEEQTRELNIAIQTLRKNYNPKVQTQPTPPKNNWFSSPGNQKEKKRPAPQQPRFTFRPLLVYERWFISLARTGGALAFGVLGALLLQNANESPYAMACGSALTLFGVNGAIRHSLLLLIRHPVLRIDKLGIQSLDSGTLGWKDVSKVWSLTSAGQTALAIEYSPDYLNRQSFITKFLLRLHYTVRRAHFVLSCGGLDHHPNDVVRAIEAQHLTVSGTPPLVRTAQQSPAVKWSQIIALACAASLIFRSLVSLETPLTELLIYVSIFSLCQGYQIASRLLTQPKEL